MYKRFHRRQNKLGSVYTQQHHDSVLGMDVTESVRLLDQGYSHSLGETLRREKVSSELVYHTQCLRQQPPEASLTK